MKLSDVVGKRNGAFYQIVTGVHDGKQLHVSRERYVNDTGAPIDTGGRVEYYFCPHGLRDRRRTKSDAVLDPILWCDVDDYPLSKLNARLKPTVCWETSPGKLQAVWWLNKRPKSHDEWERLNKIISYSLSSDTSGWHLGKLLRIPGTLNLKPGKGQRGRLIHADGPSYDIEDIERRLRDGKLLVDRKVPPGLIKTLRRRDVSGEDRSSELFRQYKYLKKYLTYDEIADVVEQTAWNKFRTRERLEQDIERAFMKDVIEDEEREAFEPQTARNHPPLHTVWLVPNLIPMKELTIVEGDPGDGKSLFMQTLCYCIGVKRRFDNDLLITGKSLIVTPEDTGSTIRSRLDAWGGGDALDNVLIYERAFTLDDSRVQELAEFITREGVKLVVFDTMLHFVGDVNMNSNVQMGKVTALFREIALDTGAAVVVIRHLKKGRKDESSRMLGSGAMSITGVARNVLMIVRDEEDRDRRIVVVSKSNIGPDNEMKAFRIVVEKGTPLVRFEEPPDTLDVTAAASSIKHEVRTKRGDGVEILRDLLSQGPMRYRDLRTQAEAKGVRKDMLYKVREKLGVTARRGVWSLPKDVKR